MLEGVAAKTGSVASTSSTVQESQERREEKGRVVLNSPFFWTSPKAAGPIRASVRGRAPPARLFHGEKNNLISVLKLLPGLHIYNITTFVIVLIHTFLQPFIKV